MKHTRQTRLAQYILAALAAGVLGSTPVAWALPVQDTGHTNTTGTNITTTGSTMGISGTADNNVMNWQSFSIAKGETVAFNDNHNYLNLVRGTSQSEINGALTGAGTIYLINPNGILFGATAQVNVGNLVASTRAISEEGAASFAASGTNPLASSASAAAGDIVNLGKLQTASVTLEGNNITIRNAADITSNGTTALTSAVTVKAAGTIAVGHETATTTRTFKISGVDTVKTVHDYANANANVRSGYTTSNLVGGENAVKESMLVENVYDLQNMDAKLGGSYMLAGNIDASETSKWNDGAGFSPVGNAGSPFAGSFDGLNYTITGLYINRSATNYVGLMGVSGGTIQNVGLVDGSITGAYYVGGVTGDNNGTVQNVYNTGAVSGTGNHVGGVVGNNEGGTVQNVYNTGAVSGMKSVGGVAGYSERGMVKNAYNTGAVSGTGSYVGGVVGNNSQSGMVTNVYNTGVVSGISCVGGVVGYSIGTITNVYNTAAVSGSQDYVGGVVGRKTSGDVTNAWYANTADAAGKVKINTTSNGVGTGEALANLQTKALEAYGFVTDGSTAWRTYAEGAEGTLVATTPMLKAFQSTALDAAIDHTAVQYGTAEAPLTNIYQASKAVTIDYASLSLPGNVGACIINQDLTVNNFAPGAGNTSSWGSYADVNGTGGQLTLKNSSGFTVNRNMTLQGNSITLTTESSAAGTIIDYGRNITSMLKITAKDIVLDTDRVNSAAGSTTVTLTAAGTAKAGYTPKGTMNATVNGASVSVPDYAKALKRDKAPTLSAGDGGVAISEGQWIKNVLELQAMGTSAATLSKTYFLYGDIDASATKSWNSGDGFSPVGNDSTNFDRTFDGLNHTINGLTINRSKTDYVGLFGYSFQGTIQNVGLVGGSINGKQYVGGVVGYHFRGTITNAYNTGAVSGTWNVGGVAGYNVSGTITNAYNTGAVSGNLNVGGVEGRNSGDGTIINAYNTGAVSGSGNVGGVAGRNYGTIKNAYNTGAVKGTNNVGGVAGYSDGTITNALWANDLSYTLADGYSKPTKAVSNMDDSGTVMGAKLAEMKLAETFSDWTDGSGNKIVAATGGANTAWRIYEGYTTPLLTSFFKGVVKVTGLTVAYNGQNQTADVSQLTFDSGLADTSHIFLAGSVGRNVGTYGAAYSEQQGYDLLNAPTLTITPKTLTATLTGDNVFSKVYDGTTTVSQGLGTNYALDGLVTGDKVSLSAGSGVYADKNAGDNKQITFQGLTLTGTGAGNYTIAATLSGNTGRITRREVTGSLTPGYSFDKVYDGTTAAALGSGYTLNGLAAGDKVPLMAAKGFYDSSAVGDRTVTFSGFSIQDGNYLLRMADSLTGIGRIRANGANNNANGVPDYNYNDALAGVNSFFGINPAGGYTIFRGTPEDYVARALSRMDRPGYEAGAAQAVQTWYSGPVSITIVNGGITLPPDILLGGTFADRTVIVRGADSYQS